MHARNPPSGFHLLWTSMKPLSAKIHQMLSEEALAQHACGRATSTLLLSFHTDDAPRKSIGKIPADGRETMQRLQETLVNSAMA